MTTLSTCHMITLTISLLYYTKYLHPPFFSIAVLHLGQSLVFVCNQFPVSESSWHFLNHSFITLQSAGTCASSEHLFLLVTPWELFT